MEDNELQMVPTKMTKRILTEMEELIKQGWYVNKSEFIRDAVRELVKKLKVAQLESAIKEDIAWGLYGK